MGKLPMYIGWRGNVRNWFISLRKFEVTKQHYVPKFRPTTTITRIRADIVNLPVNQNTSPLSSTLNLAFQLKTASCQKRLQARSIGKGQEFWGLPSKFWYGWVRWVSASWQDVNVNAVCK
jgi:hypothetical protein